MHVSSITVVLNAFQDSIYSSARLGTNENKAQIRRAAGSFLRNTAPTMRRECLVFLQRIRNKNNINESRCVLKLQISPPCPALIVYFALCHGFKNNLAKLILPITNKYQTFRATKCHFTKAVT